MINILFHKFAAYLCFASAIMLQEVVKTPTEPFFLGILPFNLFYKSMVCGFVGQFLMFGFILHQMSISAIDKGTEVKFTQAHILKIVTGLIFSPVLALVVSTMFYHISPTKNIIYVSLFCGVFFESFSQREFLLDIFDRVMKKNNPK